MFINPVDVVVTFVSDIGYRDDSSLNFVVFIFAVCVGCSALACMGSSFLGVGIKETRRRDQLGWTHECKLSFIDTGDGMIDEQIKAWEKSVNHGFHEVNDACRIEEGGGGK